MESNELRQDEIDRYLKEVETMSHYEMARLWRFSPPGSPYFDKRYPVWEVFNKRFQSLGGMTPEISKQLGWQ